MSKLRHTKTPWGITSLEGKVRLIGVEGKIIATISRLKKQESEANASLIAAAPEMLDYLVQLADYYIDVDSYINEELVGVIEKATGLPIEEVLK